LAGLVTEEILCEPINAADSGDRRLELVRQFSGVSEALLRARQGGLFVTELGLFLEDGHDVGQKFLPHLPLAGGAGPDGPDGALDDELQPS
jgi:hypothetical protein